MHKKLVYRFLQVIFLLLVTFSGLMAQGLKREISGEIIDSVTHQPLQAASVTILNASDSTVIAGIYTDNNGKFHLSFSSSDSAILSISYLGYQPGFSLLRFKNGNNIHMKKILLPPLKNTLQEVTVVAEKKPMYEFKKDTMVFNVPEDFMTGGTAMDVLQYTPELTFDGNNNILVKGQGNVGVYVDSRPIALTGMDVQTYLQNTPSFMIEKIEILKTPPDPEDAAEALAEGITDRYYLNIITRKIRYKGYSASLTGGTNSRNELLGRARFNLNLEPFQLNYFNNLRNSTDSNYLHRISYFGNGDSSLLNQKNYNTALNFNQYLNASYEFKFSDKERLRLNAKGGWNQSKSNSTGISIINNPKDIPDQNLEQYSERHSNGYNINSNADYLKDYDKEGKELHATMQVSQGVNQNRAMSVGQYLIRSDTLNQLNEGLGSQLNFRSNVQFKNTFGNEKFYMLNGSMNFSQRHNLNDVSRSDTSTHSSEMYENSALSTNYFSTSSNYSVLGLIGKKDQKLGWSGVLSLAYYLQNGRDHYQLSSFNNGAIISHNAIGMNYSPGKDQEINLSFNPGLESYTQKTSANDSVPELTYRYTNFIPGAHIKYSAGDHEITLSYNRNINRPNWDQINPYINNLDPLNIREGNPELRPSFTNAYNLRYEYNHKAVYAAVSLGKNISKDVISSYTTVDSNGVSNTTFVNLNSRINENAGLNAGFHYFKDIPSLKGNLNLNVDGGMELYHLQSDDIHVSKDFQNVTGFSSNAKMWTSLRAGILSLNIYGRYEGPRYFSQGKRPSRFSSGLRARADFMQRKLNVSLGIANLFGASVKDNFYKTANYIQYSDNRKDVRYFSVYITYNFRKYKKSGKDESGS
ncbi:MAG: TonB-dependent receptor [Chitinophagaceae bacterium]|nr:MAG: TonB-dependent receptor [Chitinophagaceae bacterium]